MRLVHALTLADITTGFDYTAAYLSFTQVGTSPLYYHNSNTRSEAAVAGDGIRVLNYSQFSLPCGPAVNWMKATDVIVYGFFLYPWTASSPIGSSSAVALTATSYRGGTNLLTYSELSVAMDNGRASFVEVAVNFAGTQATVRVNGALVKTVGINVEMESLAFNFIKLSDSRYAVIGEFYAGIFDPTVENTYLGRWKCEVLTLDSSEFKDVTTNDGKTDLIGSVPKSTVFSYAGVNKLKSATVLCSLKTPFSYTLSAEVTSGDVVVKQESAKLPNGQPGATPATPSEYSYPVAGIAFDNVTKLMSVKLSVKE